MLRSGRIAASLGLVLAAGCSSPAKPTIEIHADGDAYSLVTSFVDLVPYQPIKVLDSADPAAEIASSNASDDDFAIAVISDLTDCTECYRLERSGVRGGYIVHGDAPLGVQYGLAAMFEQLGFRFFHPFDTFVPDPPTAPTTDDGFDLTFTPEIARRGLHLHTLHPIEPFYAFWQPSEEHLAEARRIVDWIVKNRGNYVQWVALDDIERDPATATAWRDYTRQLLDLIHGRGLEAGIGIQLFGQSNLQQGFDLIDDEDGDPTPRQEMEQRYPILADLGFDSISLSFGEFFGEDPDVFIQNVDLAYDVLQEQAPGTRMTATIHVGNSPDQRIDYQGENIIYYFLVKWANPAIVPWIHTVMYYDLFEDAGGAYHHDDFSEHRAYLLERLDAGEPVGYHPETAYWVAFDNSVPTYLPLYIRSRWLDLDQIRAATTGALDEQVLFSSGWEWGYWQNDYAALRMSYHLPTDWRDEVVEMMAPFGDAGSQMAAAIDDLAAAQHDALIEQRLAPYLAGRDFYIDVGDQVGIVSQPDRVLFEEVAAMSPTELDAFTSTVLDPLTTLRDRFGEIYAVVDRIEAGGPARIWRDELRDGLAVDTARLRFVCALYQAAAALARGDATDALLAEADDAFAAGRTAVDRRHQHLHYPNPELLLTTNTNATYYQFGYLKQADEMCYWDRERAQLRNLVDGTDDAIPTCVF